MKKQVILLVAFLLMGGFSAAQTRGDAVFYGYRGGQSSVNGKDNPGPGPKPSPEPGPFPIPIPIPGKECAKLLSSFEDFFDLSSEGSSLTGQTFVGKLLGPLGMAPKFIFGGPGLGDVIDVLERILFKVGKTATERTLRKQYQTIKCYYKTFIEKYRYYRASHDSHTRALIEWVLDEMRSALNEMGIWTMDDVIDIIVDNSIILYEKLFKKPVKENLVDGRFKSEKDKKEYYQGLHAWMQGIYGPIGYWNAYLLENGYLKRGSLFPTSLSKAYEQQALLDSALTVSSAAGDIEGAKNMYYALRKEVNGQETQLLELNTRANVQALNIEIAKANMMRSMLILQQMEYGRKHRTDIVETVKEENRNAYVTRLFEDFYGACYVVPGEQFERVLRGEKMDSLETLCERKK